MGFTRIFSQISNGSCFFWWSKVWFQQMSQMFIVRKYDEWDEDFQLGGYSNT